MRLIDADAFERRVMFDSEIEDLQDVIYALRDYESIADAVQVVRCKDCKHYREADPAHPDCDWCNRMICGTIKPDFFCADGERRNER